MDQVSLPVENSCNSKLLISQALCIYRRITHFLPYPISLLLLLILGILVVYPLLDLRRYKQDLHWYLRQIEQVIIQVLNLYDIAAYRDQDTGMGDRSRDRNTTKIVRSFHI